MHTAQPHANVRHALFSLLIRNDIMQGGNKVEVKMEEQQSQNEEKVQKMDFTVLNASDSRISMQFSEHMKLPQVSLNLGCNPLKADLQTIPPNHLKLDRNVRRVFKKKKKNHTLKPKS